MNRSESQQPQLNTIRQRALIVGIAGLVLCIAGVFWNSAQFFQSYLFGYLFWIGLSLGCFAILMLHHLVGGSWGFVIQRLLEAGASTLPLMALLFIPLLFGMKDLYVWARPEEVAHDTLLQHKSLYLNVPFFAIRCLGYFVAWVGVSYLLNRWSLEQDRTGDPTITRRLKLCSGLGLAVYGGTITLASVDWVMSLEPHWFSTVYGVLFIVGNALTTIAFMIVALALVCHWRLSTPHDDDLLFETVVPRHFHDLGNLMLAFVMLWAYIAFSQYLIIWSGNLPEEIHWYLHRTGGSWKAITVVLIIFHFFLPFLLLLSPRTKRRRQIVATLAGGMLLMRLIDLFWLVVPAFHHESFHLHLLDLATAIGIGGIWIAAFVWQVQKRALLPLHDPRLQALSTRTEEAHHA